MNAEDTSAGTSLRGQPRLVLQLLTELLLIGQIGKEAVNSKQVKPVQAILQLLWDMAHIPEIPKHLVERAFAEHLATINEITLNKDAMKKQYVLNCVDDIKKNTHCVLPAVKQLYAICK